MSNVLNNGFLKEAIRLSIENIESNAGGPFGAVIVRDGQIIGRGCNCVEATHDPTAHAEVTAIRDACGRLKTFSLAGCEIYTSCEPCPMCLAAIYWSRLDRIFYAATQTDADGAGFDDEKIYREFSLPVAARSIPMEQSLRDEACVAFQRWMLKEDRVGY
ncbi:MAG TPA: nucleoside deaminase [Tepidisphaeraceae bacterium]